MEDMLEFVMSSLIALMAFCVSSHGLNKTTSSSSDLYTRPNPQKILPFDSQFIPYMLCVLYIHGYSPIHAMSMTRTTHK